MNRILGTVAVCIVVARRPPFDSLSGARLNGAKRSISLSLYTSPRSPSPGSRQLDALGQSTR